MFFSDRVILVEGNSDEYFFKYFIENYYLSSYPKEDSIEILSIDGKTNYEKWNEFLKLFDISSYYICDLDNVSDFGIIHSANIPYSDILKNSKNEIIKKFVGEKIKRKPSKDGIALFNALDKFINNDFDTSEEVKVSLRSLWIYLMEKQSISRNHFISYLKKPENRKFYKKLIQEIEKKYLENIFILKQGDLEHYLKLSGSKDLSKVIEFCSDNFDDWIKKEMTYPKASKLNEITEILDNIYK